MSPQLRHLVASDLRDVARLWPAPITVIGRLWTRRALSAVRGVPLQPSMAGSYP